MGTVSSASGFIFQFPATSESVTGFGKSHLFALAVVENGFGERIVLRTTAANIQAETVRKRSRLTQRCAHPLQLFAAKILFNGSGMFLADVNGFFQNVGFRKDINNHMIFCTLVRQDIVIAEFVHAAGISQDFFRGILVKDSLIVYFAVIITLPSDSHVDVIREKATDRNEAVFVEVCTIAKPGNDSVIFLLVKSRALNIHSLKALAQLICASHIQDSVRQAFDASSGHSILRPASPEVYAVFNDAALIDVMEFWEGCADKLHTQHWLITFRIDVVNRKVQGFETYIVRSITRTGPTARIPFCDELVSHPVGNGFRQAFPFLDIEPLFQRLDALCDGCEKVIAEIFLAVIRFLDKLVEQPGSDAHKENCVGLAGTYLPDHIHSEDDLINYINDGNHPEVGGKRYPKTLKDKIGPAGKFLTYGFYLYNIYGAFRNYPARCRAYFAASAKLKAKMKSNCSDRGLDSKK